MQLMEERPAVEEWRATLTAAERHNLNNPTIAWRKWTAATRVTKPKPRTAGVSASEHRRARGTIEEMQARIEELEEENAAAQWGPAIDEADRREIQALLDGLYEEGRKNMATMSPGDVATLVLKLDRKLFGLGLIPKSAHIAKAEARIARAVARSQ
jgi:hypothetical protein